MAKFKVISNVCSLLPTQWDDYEKMKKDLRKFGFEINDETDEIKDPNRKINLTPKDIKFIDTNFHVFWDFEKTEVEFRLK